MIIFLNNLRRILKSRQNIMFMIVVPVIFILFTMGGHMKEGHFELGVIDNDKTKLTQILVDNLKTKNEVVSVPRGEANKYLIDKRFDYVIEIRKGFTKGSIDGEDIKLKGYSIKETNSATPVKFQIESFLNSVKNISNVSKGNAEKFYSGMDNYKNGSFTAKYHDLGNGKSNKSTVIRGLGFLVMSMLFLSTNAAENIIKDKKSKVYYRIFSTPTTIKSYMLQNIASFLVVSIIQIIIIFTFMIKVFNADFGPSIINMFIMFLAFAMSTVSLGVFIASVSKNMRQAGLISTLLNTPVCMIGGCFWPRKMMPDMLQKISNFVPTTWILKGAEKLIYGDKLNGVTTEISILLLFSVVFFLLSSWRKADIVK